MVSFCENEVDCRRVLSLRYFGESFSDKDCHETCDNCLRRKGPVVEEDLTDLSVAILNLVKLLNSNCGLNETKPATIFSILVGSKNKLSKDRGFESYPGFNAGKGFIVSDLTRLLHHLISIDSLVEHAVFREMGGTSIFYSPGPKFERVLNRQEIIKLSFTSSGRRTAAEKKKKPTKSKTTSKKSVHELVDEGEADEDIDEVQASQKALFIPEVEKYAWKSKISKPNSTSGVVPKPVSHRSFTVGKIKVATDTDINNLASSEVNPPDEPIAGVDLNITETDILSEDQREELKQKLFDILQVAMKKVFVKIYFCFTCRKLPIKNLLLIMLQALVF